jgi:hypothetical protein
VKHFFTRNTSDLSLAKYSVAQGVCEDGLILSPEAQEEQCLCTEQRRRKEQKVEKPFEVSQSTKLRSSETSMENLLISRSILEFGVWSGKGFWSHCIANSRARNHASHRIWSTVAREPLDHGYVHRRSAHRRCTERKDLTIRSSTKDR